ncbi:hypothetical protein [Verrucomicrobium sp. BvORR106]|uniref:hypothetical protein n=1 Tax=Verrucomicrobium sp. BvORR106 TaxID=1403819 RepID=UPI00056E0F44|nr:hypothetical protein [Verrucomicrobium sp. BvORR106]
MHNKSLLLLMGVALCALDLPGADTSNPPGLKPPALPDSPTGASMVVPEAHGIGYTLVVPRFSTQTLLLDGRGREVHTWPGTTSGGESARMLSDGSLLRLASTPLSAPFNQLGVSGGRLQHIAWDGRLLWDFADATSDHLAYGDLLKLPNGNVLVSVLEFKTRQECEARGREPGLVTDKGMLVPGLMEFSPRGKSAGVPVWKWSLWDHLFQGRNPNLPEYQYPGEKKGAVDLGSLSGSKGPVWMTPAVLDYNAEEDLLLVVMGGLGEVWVLDHGTTPAEAATREGGRRGAGGQLLLRWKGPAGAPGAAEPPASRVISAHWARGSSAAAGPGLNVMRYEGQPYKPVVEFVSLNRETLQPAGAPQVTFRPADGGGKQPLPSGMDWLSDSGAAMFSENLHGKVHLQQGAKTLWTHTNQHGRVKLRPQVVKPGEECCGNTAAPAQTAAKADKPEPVKLPEMEVAPVSRVRLYPPDFLKR